MKDYVIPTAKNNHTPKLLGRGSMIIYVLILLVFAFFTDLSGFISADKDFTPEKLLEEHNQEREKHGLGNLQLSYRLSESATNKAIEMLKHDCWSHYCPFGRDWTTYISDQDYIYVHAGENLAEGFRTVSASVDAWMNSPTHRENILNANFNEVGFGIIRGDFQGKSGNTIVVVHFGRESAYASAIAATDTVQDLDINIIVPKNGDSVTNENFNVSGEIKSPNSSVDILINNEPAGRVEAEGSNYTFRPRGPLDEGEYKIQSFSGEIGSNIIEITLDETYPSYYQGSLSVTEGSDYYKVSFETTEIVEDVTTTIAGIEFKRVSNARWETRIPADVFNQNSTIPIVLTDQAGNTNQTEIAKESLEKASQDISIQDRFSAVLQSVPTIFIIYLVVLLIIDFVILYKKDLLHNVARKTHLHLPIFILLILAVLSGQLSGNIIDSVSI